MAVATGRPSLSSVAVAVFFLCATFVAGIDGSLLGVSCNGGHFREIVYF